MKKFMVALAVVAALSGMTGCGSNYYTANGIASVDYDTYEKDYEVSWTDKESGKQSVRFDEKDDALDFAKRSLNANTIYSNFDY